MENSEINNLFSDSVQNELDISEIECNLDNYIEILKVIFITFQK